MGAKKPFNMEDAWDSQMMMGVGMGDLRGMGSLQQPSCSRQEMHQEMSMASPEHQEMHHQEVMGQQQQQQAAEYFGSQVRWSNGGGGCRWRCNKWKKAG